MLGRGVENSILGFCIDVLETAECSELFGEFISSGRNAVAQQSYLDMNFDKVKGGYSWKKGVKQAKMSPWIDLKKL